MSRSSPPPTGAWDLVTGRLPKPSPTPDTKSWITKSSVSPSPSVGAPPPPAPLSSQPALAGAWTQGGTPIPPTLGLFGSSGAPSRKPIAKARL